MKIILVMAETVDGKTTKWDESHIHGWSSPEDQRYLDHLKSSHNLIVMGRKTYESVKSEIKLSPQLRRVVMTQRPDDFSTEEVADQLEFTDESPKRLVQRLASLGYWTMLLVGGNEVNEVFLSEQLITECLITVEPKFFGSGKSIFSPTNVDISLRLITIKQLNEQGTLLLHYTVSYEH